MDAAKLLQQGLSEAEVARRVGVRRQSVHRWAQRLAESGQQGLKQADRAGRKPRLSLADRNKIERGLEHGPEALGYDTSVWTGWRVAHLIEEDCGVRYHPGHVWRILRQLGWTGQRATGRALKRDEDATLRWKKKRRRGIQKKPKPRAARSSLPTQGGWLNNCIDTGPGRHQDRLRCCRITATGRVGWQPGKSKYRPFSGTTSRPNIYTPR